MRPPNVPDDVHRRVKACAALNGLQIQEAYPLIICSVLDDDGTVNDDALTDLETALPAEEPTAFD